MRQPDQFVEQVYVPGRIVVAGVVLVGRLCRVDSLHSHGPASNLPSAPAPVVLITDAAQAHMILLGDEPGCPR